MVTAIAAVAYLATAKLAQLLAVPPSYAVAIWPPFGVALALALVYGNRSLPGIMLGATIANTTKLMGIADFGPASTTGTLIAGGATFAAWLGARLLTRRRDATNTWTTERGVLAFMLLGCVIPSMVSAVCGTMAVHGARALAVDDVAFNLATWWAGDLIGAFTFTPLALMILPDASARWRIMRKNVGIPLLGAVGITIATYLLASRGEMGQIREAFDRRVDSIHAAVNQRLERVTEDLQVLAAFFDSSVHVGEDEFGMFARLIQDRRTGIRAFEWTPRIKSTELEHFEQAARVDHPDYKVWSATESRGCEIWPIRYIEPLTDNEHSVGQDLYSEPAWRASILTAVRSGTTCFSDPLHATVGEPAFAFLPTYEHGTAADTVQEREAQAKGVVLAAFSLQDLFATVWPTNPREISCRVLDIHGHVIAANHGTAVPPPAIGGFSFDLPLTVPGQTWRLELIGTRDFVASRRPLQAWGMLLAGMLFCGMLGMVLLLSAGRTTMIADQVEQRTAELSATNERLAQTVVAQQQTEDALRHSQHELQEAQARARMGSCEFDLDGGTGTWSQTMFDLFARAPSQGPASLDDLLGLHVHPEDRDSVRRASEQALAQAAAQRIDFRTDPTHGRQRFVSAILEPTTDTAGKHMLVGSFLDISDRMRAEANLRRSLREKEVMLQEIHHRVKNNLQVVCSLLSIQARRTAEPEAADILRESQNRIQAMSQIHEMLYRADDLASIDMGSYLNGLCRHLAVTQEVHGGRVHFEFDVAPLTVALEQAVPLGLIVNELITNALKHAFPNEMSGTVSIRFRNIDDGEYELTVEDNGVGMDTDIDPLQRTSLGLSLVSTLTHQIEGKLAVDGSDGTTFRVSFRSMRDEPLAIA